MTTDFNNMVIVGLNSRVAALDRNTGQTLWQWRATKPRSHGYVSLLLLDEKQLIVSVNGYTYSLDPHSGKEHWYNELSGFGSGVTSIVAPGQQSSHTTLLAAAAQTADRNSTAATTGAGG